MIFGPKSTICGQKFKSLRFCLNSGAKSCHKFFQNPIMGDGELVDNPLRKNRSFHKNIEDFDQNLNISVQISKVIVKIS